jgi:membrane protease YdiL (CAAX protease family)
MWRFFLLIIAFSLPFWLLGALSGFQLLPGLPLSALGFVCPVTAALVLSWRENGAGGIRDLLKRSLDVGRGKHRAWLLPVILLVPFVFAAAWGFFRATGMALPLPQVPVLRALELLIVFFIGGLCEELGWSGYATDPLQARFGALTAALVIGGVWAAWHFVPLAEAHRSFAFVAWWTLGTVSMRVIIVWLYNATDGSVFVAALLHAMFNFCWQLFPINGSFYDPRLTGLILMAVALLSVVLLGSMTHRKEYE